MKNILLCFILLILGFNFSNAQEKEDKKIEKEEKQETEYIATKKAIESAAYKFNASWVNTQKGKRINIQGDGDFIEINKNQGKGYLPFFGVAHSAPIGGNGGIEFDGAISDYEVKYNDDKKRINIQFTVDGEGERFDVSMTVQRGGNTTVTVVSNKRQSNSYNGTTVGL